MRNPDRETTFRFREFAVRNELAGMKVGTDAVLLGAWALEGCDFSPHKIVDAGTGTGVIALLMAQRFGDAEIIAPEISAEAVAEAAANFAASPWSERLQAVHGDFNDFTQDESLHGNVDLLIGNPPFFTNGELASDSSRRLARHAGSLSPLSMIAAAEQLLSSHGRLCMVSTADEAARIEFEASLCRLHVERRTDVATGEGKPPRRILWQMCRHATPTSRNSLVIRDRQGYPTPEYIRLVEPYYLTIK